MSLEIKSVDIENEEEEKVITVFSKLRLEAKKQSTYFQSDLVSARGYFIRKFDLYPFRNANGRFHQARFRARQKYAQLR